MSVVFKKYAKVMLDLGLKGALDYGISEKHLDHLEKGMCVKVTLRGVLQTGIIVDFSTHSDFKKVLPVEEIVSNTPLMTPKLFELAEWISKYYNTPLPKTLKLFFPKSVRKGMGHKEQKVVVRKISLQEMQTLCISLRKKSPAQAKVLDEMLKVEKEIFLTELLERSTVSSSAIVSLEKKGVLELLKARVSRNPLDNAEYFQSPAKKLNIEQQEALKKINDSIQANLFKTFLLHGVTGSGKTEIYLQAIDQALKMGKSCLMLVPEIALTTQTIEKFKSRFKDKIAVLHHRLSQGERYDTWHDIRAGKISIALGARSAIFAPLNNLGLLIVDEEHEGSYKQNDEMPTYNARDVAVMRAKMNDATIILGTATPSLESYSNALSGKYHLLEMKNRVNQQKMPEIKLIDMKREAEKNKGYTLFSSQLLKEIENRYQKGEQSILFLNRRGYHTSLMCPECGRVEKCTKCDISLTFHRKKDLLSCHLCDTHMKPPRVCLDCKSQTLKFKGVGTENVETQLKNIFPSIRVLRMDSDTTKHVGSYEKLYYAFRNQKADVLIGTQMIAKGLHFPNVTLVGVLSCDQQFNLPDFKASEIAFQMLMQVAGRAGRGDVSGAVFVQTFNMGNPILKHALSQDYLSFYNQEIESRKFFNYSPFTHLVKIVFKGKLEDKTLELAQKFYRKLKFLMGVNEEVHEPLPCGYPKIKEIYRFQILLKGRNIYQINQKIEQVKNDLYLPSGIRLLIDIDPSSTFF